MGLGGRGLPLYACGFKHPNTDANRKKISLCLQLVVPDVGPEIVAYYNTSSTTFYIQWNHTIPPNRVNGILIGYRVWWNDELSDDHLHKSTEKAVNLGLDATNYTITSLHENWPYEIRVMGRTAVGGGKASTVSVMTPDDGKKVSAILLRLICPSSRLENSSQLDIILPKYSETNGTTGKYCSEAFIRMITLQDFIHKLKS